MKQRKIDILDLIQSKKSTQKTTHYVPIINMDRVPQQHTYIHNSLHFVKIVADRVSLIIVIATVVVVAEYFTFCRVL